MGRLVLVALNGPPSFTTYAASGCRAAVGLSSAAAARPRMCGSLAVTGCALLPLLPLLPDACGPQRRWAWGERLVLPGF